MEAFAKKLFEDLGVENPFSTADAAYILSFSTILLNTDLHNTQIPVNKKMTKFIPNKYIFILFFFTA
jgi:Sec7-like guanine-nucleotide exchange factor